MKQYQKQADLKNRLIFLTLTIQFFFLIIIMRLWYLQIIKYSTFHKLSVENRTRLMPIKATRGLFFDCNGKLLVNNRASYNIAIIPEDIKKNKTIIPMLCELLEITPKSVNHKLRNKKKSFTPIILKYDASEQIVAILEENRNKYPGVMILIEPCRDYIKGELGSHLFGYLGEINERELKKNEYKYYRQGDLIGKTGIELTYEKYLRGIDGKSLVEVNAVGQQVSSNVLKEYTPGYNLVLSINKELQEIAEKCMEGRIGAIVAINPKNGEILAMVSKPGFDSNLFAVEISGQKWKELNDDINHPLFNRTVVGAYPPGSTFKIVSSIAALEEKIITPEYTELCNGEFNYGNITYKCWKKGGHGIVNVTEALINSCNIFYYRLGLKIGIKNIEKYSRELGLGNITGVDLPQERQGHIPNPKWKKAVFKEGWYPGDDVISSIGQGSILVTPIQMVNLISALTNGGVIYKPHLVKKILTTENKLIFMQPVEIVKNVKISSQTLNVIRDALWKVVNRSGTGRRTRIPGLNIIGKTGTAQVVARAEIYDDVETSEIPEAIRPHAWFVTSAPLDNPKIAIALLVEHGGEGGQICAPIAKQMYDVYLKDEAKDYALDFKHHPEDIPFNIKKTIDSTTMKFLR